MRRTIAFMGSAMLGLSVAAWASNAAAQAAQEAPPWSGVLPAPTNAFEVKLGSGYTQGLGRIAPGMHVISVAGAGIGFSLDLDYRINPIFSVGIETQYQEFMTENDGASRGLAVNVGITGHAAPLSHIYPFLRLGSGYRLLWQDSPNFDTNVTNLYHGFDALTGKVGIDFRVSKYVAFAPVIGADLQTFSWINNASSGTTELATFVYAGLQGRFDAGGSTPQTPIAKNTR